eukprot:TRINITY_DN1461_c0_g1_i4.p1 TRINITY_DN1461_c0_g1~~TRINITY_DN1461_c0_g1_i4.p1  ORF type:complete len:228 (-),score=73.85 TRINITY_DN1461_c0_g1_i4:140-796(-)
MGDRESAGSRLNRFWDALPGDSGVSPRPMAPALQSALALNRTPSSDLRQEEEAPEKWDTVDGDVEHKQILAKLERLQGRPASARGNLGVPQNESVIFDKALGRWRRVDDPTGTQTEDFMKGFDSDEEKGERKPRKASDVDTLRKPSISTHVRSEQYLGEFELSEELCAHFRSCEQLHIREYGTCFREEQPAQGFNHVHDLVTPQIRLEWMIHQARLNC